MPTPDSTQDITARLSRISQGMLKLAVVLWLANWTASYVELTHGPVFLALVGAFLVSTLPRRSAGRH